MVSSDPWLSFVQRAKRNNANESVELGIGHTQFLYCLATVTDHDCTDLNLVS